MGDDFLVRDRDGVCGLSFCMVIIDIVLIGEYNFVWIGDENGI